MAFQFMAAFGQNEVKDTISGTKELTEVEVLGRAPQVINNGSVTKIRVKGTILEKMSNVISMLSNTPGLHRQGEKFVVNGSQEPVFLINGREVKDMSQLSTLSPDMVATVEIDVAPGLDHSDGIKPVVSIKTAKNLSDYLYLSLGNNAEMKRKFSDGIRANFRTQLGKYSTELSYRGGYTNTLIPETYFRNIYHSDYCFKVTQPHELQMNDKKNIVRWNNDFIINQYNRLGFEYDYNGGISNNTEEGEDVSEFKDYTSVKHINRGTDSKKETHSFTLEYNYKKGSNNLLITQDLAVIDSHSDLLVIEQPAQQKDVLTNVNSHYNVYSSYLNYKRTLPLDFVVSLTSRLSVVSSRSATKSNNMYLTDGNYWQSNDGFEIYPRTNLTITKKLGKYTLSVGGLHQYINRRFSFKELSLPEQETTIEHNFVNPYLHFQYNNKEFNAYIEYATTKVEPQFNKMNNGSSYQDSLSYIGSSATLSGSETKYVKAGVTYKGANLTFRFSRTKEPMVEVYKIPTEDSNIATLTPINLDNSNRFSAMFSYRKSLSKFDIYADMAVIFPYTKYKFIGEENKSNFISFDANIILNYTINRNLGLLLTFNQQGHNTRDIATQHSVSKLDLGLTGSFINNQLTIDLVATDIMQRANYNNITMQYENMSYGTYGKNDFRGIELSVNYIIFSKKVNVRTTTRNSELSRVSQ